MVEQLIRLIARQLKELIVSTSAVIPAPPEGSCPPIVKTTVKLGDI
jgi:hypothetical protein